jgi:hypothetical protein
LSVIGPSCHASITAGYRDCETVSAAAPLFRRKVDGTQERGTGNTRQAGTLQAERKPCQLSVGRFNAVNLIPKDRLA